MTPYYERGGLTLHLADCREAMAEMAENSVDAIVTDPPYGLEFMGKEWDKLLVRERDAAYPSCRHAHGSNAYLAGMKAQEWHYTWAVAALRVLKPGGHALVFGGTRTFHRLTCALEDAGFEIRDCLSWLYGSGFPKSLDVSKAIDKAAGAESVDLGLSPNSRSPKPHEKGGFAMADRHLTAPATDAARQWAGWGTALKPAWEPIILCRKPLTGTVAANVQEHGTGALNIGAARIGLQGEQAPSGSGDRRHGKTYAQDEWTQTQMANGGNTTHPAGRWPANLLLDEEAGAMLDAQSGERPVSGAARLGADSQYNQAGKPGMFGVSGGDPAKMPNDSGGASRFFFQAKASSSERGGSHHPTVKPLNLMRYLCRLITPPKGLILDPFAGSGTTLETAHLEGFRCIGIEMSEEYCADAERRLGKYLL